MPDLNNLITIIKKKCDQQQKFAEVACFESIANEARIPINSLPYYPEQLQSEGLIKFSWDDRFLYVTVKGRRYRSYSELAEQGGEKSVN